METKRILGSMAMALCLTAPTTLYADDSDIYFNPNPPVNPPEPLVMLSFDLRPNVISSGNLCTLGVDCVGILGTEINTELERINTAYSLGLSSITMYDAIRAVYATVINELEGVRLGIMASHDSGGGASGGGYMLRGFRSMKANDTNRAKEELVSKMFSLPGPSAAAVVAPPPPSTSCTATVAADKTAGGYGMTVTINDVAATEGGNVVFTLTGGGTNTTNSSKNITITTTYPAAPGTATAGSDYTAVSTTVSVNKDKIPWHPSGTATFTVPTILDAVDPESIENFPVLITIADNPDGNTAVGSGTICPFTAAELSIDDVLVTEGLTATFTVTSTSAAPAGGITFDYTTVDGDGGAGNDATSPADYTAVSGTGTIAAGATSTTINVVTKSDGGGSPGFTELFRVVISNPSSGTIADNTGFGTIADSSSCESNQISSNDAHQFQGAHMYFELYRYLTGGSIYLGHSGNSDFTGVDSPTVKNLNQECYAPGLHDDFNPDDNVATTSGKIGVLAWDVGGAKPSDATNPAVENPARTAYVSPVDQDAACGGIYAINMLFGVSNDSTPGHITNWNAAVASGGVNGLLNANSTIGASNPFADFIRILGNADLATPTLGNDFDGLQNVQSFGIRVNGLGPNGQWTAYENAGMTVINASTGDLEAFLEKLREIFRNITSVSTTFTAASVPVNVFNRTQISNNVFLALFTVDENQRPFWDGNIKKMKLGRSGNDQFLHDAVDATSSAVATDGRISFNALTFWTVASSLPDVGSTNDIYIGDEADEVVSGKDGRVVPRGAAGQRIPGFLDTTSPANVGDPGNPGISNTDLSATDPSPRRVFTNVVVSGVDTLVPLNANDTALASTLQSALGVVDVPADDTDRDEAQDLICFARGISNCTDVRVSAATPVARKWMLGDILHSRPLPINYGERSSYDDGNAATENSDIRILAGGNDGVYRMIKNTNTDGSESGVETWAFIPNELLYLNKILKTNAPSGFPPHPYGVDGESTVVTDPAGSSDEGITDITSIDTSVDSDEKAWVFFGLRRGGYSYYALDVSNPDSPSLMWHIDDSSLGFEDLGLTFSKPVVATVDYSGTPKTVLIFGGGYWGGWTDTDSNGIVDTRVGYDLIDYTDATTLAASQVTLAAEGNAIYVVDAASGELLWRAGDGSGGLPSSADNTVTGVAAVGYTDTTTFTQSITAEINVVDIDEDGIDDRAYVGDLGGNLLRIDLVQNSGGGDTRGDWQAVRLASLGGAGVDDRRFHHRVDVVFAKSGATAFDALLVGSGDRAQPTETIVENYMFMVKDKYRNVVPELVDSDSDASNDLVTLAITDLADANCFLDSSVAATADDCGASLVTANAELENGWKIELEAATGEKMLGSSTSSADGKTIFATYLPDPPGAASCANLNEGQGLLYGVEIFEGKPLNLWGTQSTPDGEKPDRYCLTCLSGGIPPPEFVGIGGGEFLLGAQIIDLDVAGRRRTHWFEKDVDQ